jgi:hypothetical protein
MYPKIDFFIGLFVLIFSAAGYMMAGNYPSVQKGLGPGDYPRVILGMLFLLGGIQAVYAFYKFRTIKQTDKKNYEKGEIKHVVLLITCVVVYIKALAYFGFPLLTPVFVFLLMYIFGLRKWIKMLVISFATTVLTFVIFEKFLYVLLPHFNLF